MFNMLQDVIKTGTGKGAKKIGRIDLAGKTGTTNEQRDAWFSGFQPNLVSVVWVGFDTPKSLRIKSDWFESCTSNMDKLHGKSFRKL